MRKTKVFYIIGFTMLLSSCGLQKMANEYETVNFNTNPKTLEVHGGKISLNLDATFAEKYFAKKATIEFTPVLVYEEGETPFKKITIQGEDATGGEATIFNATGGSFKYNDVINFSDKMLNSTLELRAVAKQQDKEKELEPKKLGNGVIATSNRVKNHENLANNNHEYEHETILTKSATIYFLVNQSNIRTTEKSDDDIKELKSFVKNGYKTHSIEIISYASPEGTVNMNDNVSENRMKSTINYTKRLLRSLKVDGARNKDLYTQTSIGEDWEGFESLIKNSNITDKRRINQIVNSIEDVEVREQQIRDLAEIYDAIEDNVLPQLRKATIIIRSYEPKRTDEEIASLSINNPEELNIKELLFSATLTEDIKIKEKIYNQAVLIHKDWRGYNNIACMHIENQEYDKAINYLNKAAKLSSENNSDILTNKGIIAARNGDLQKATKLFNLANTTENNQAILNIRKGEYGKAARYYKGAKSYNATLANILNGKNNVRCDDNSAACNYLNAIAAARSGNHEEAISKLQNAISSDVSYKNEAKNDLEFLKLRTNDLFISLIR